MEYIKVSDDLKRQISDAILEWNAIHFGQKYHICQNLKRLDIIIVGDWF